MKRDILTLQLNDATYARALAQALAPRLSGWAVRLAEEGETPDLSKGGALLFDDLRLIKVLSPAEHSRSAIFLGPLEGELSFEPWLDRFQPVSLLAGQLKALLLGDQVAPASLIKPEEVLFWAFTSGCGGTGTTSTAIACGRVLSRLWDLPTLYMDFHRFGSDCPGAAPLARPPETLEKLFYTVATGGDPGRDAWEAALSRDAYGLLYWKQEGEQAGLMAAGQEDLVAFLTCAAQQSGCARILLDLPASHCHWPFLMSLCERQLVHYGWQEARKGASARLEAVLRQLAEEAVEPAERVFSFHPSWDEESFLGCGSPVDVDIHGQLGAEVRDLVARLEEGRPEVPAGEAAC